MRGVLSCDKLFNVSKKKTAKTSKRKQVFPGKLPFILGLVFSLILAAILGYSVFQYQNSQEEAEGFFTCDKEGKVCELSQHIHADIDAVFCGEKINFPKEKGSLDLQHTHKELNLIHWHARVRVDPITRKPVDSTPMMLREFFKQVEQEIPTECRGQDAATTVLVNGVTKEEGLDYIWADGDKIEVVIE